MEMKKLTQFLIIIIVLTNFSWSQEKIKKTEPKFTFSERLKRIENGLVDFTSPESLIFPERFDSLKHSSIAEKMKSYKVPGVSISIIDKDSIHNVSYGIINAKSNVKVTQNSIFQAASTSKLLTSVIVLHFVQQGKINLDEDVNNYLKRWKIPENEFTKTAKVTLRNLLTHQSGLPTTNFPYDSSGIPTLLDVVKGQKPALNKPAIPVIKPGEKWQYSNIGYVLIQLLLEDLTGNTFQEITDEIIFKPLKMTSSTFIYPLQNEFKKREALPHDKDGYACEALLHPSAVAHGGLMTTPFDLALFTLEILKAYTGKSNTILNMEYARKLLTKEFDLDPSIFGLPLGEGLGVMLLKEGDYFLFAHPGSNLPGSNCWLIASPNSQQGAVVMTNGAMGELLAMEIISAISKEYKW